MTTRFARSPAAVAFGAKARQGPLPISRPQSIPTLLTVYGLLSTVLFAHAQTQYQFTATFDTHEKLPGAVARLKQLAAQAKWDLWCPAYQSLLDEHPDAVLAQGEERMVGLRATLHSTLAGLPAAARQAYRHHYDAAARTLWEKARAEQSAEGMRRLYLRYRHTRYGPRALRWLADRAFERGECEIARLAYRRLAQEHRLNPGWATEAEVAGLLLRWGLAATLAGQPQEARDASAQLARDHGTRELRVVGVPRRAMEVAAEEQARLRPPTPPAAEDWPMFAGRPWGGRLMTGAAQSVTRLWNVENPSTNSSSSYGGGVRFNTGPLGQMTLSSTGGSLFNQLTFPVAVGDRVYLQTPTGAAAIDSRDGKLLWHNRDLRLRGSQISRRRYYGYYRTLRNLQMAPAVAGPHLILRMPTGQMENWGSPRWPTEFALVALDTRTGSEVWTRFAGGNPLGSYFNLPTVQSSTLYTGIAVAVAGLTEFRASAVDAGTGEPLWTTYLGTGSDPMTSTDGSPPAVADGIVWIESSLHTLNALDAVTGELLWIYRYRPRPVPYYRSGWSDTMTLPNEPISLVTAAGNRILFAPRWGDQCVALDGRTGAVLWSAPKGDARTLFAVDETHAYLCGSDVQALELATGARRWNWGVPGSPPGFAALAGNRVYVPGGGTLYVLDRDSGRHVGTIALDLQGADAAYSAILLRGRQLLLAQPERLIAFEDRG